MAGPTKSPSATTGELELPPTDAMTAQSHKEVTWSATPEENAKETVEKRKNLIKYEISSTLSVKKVLKETFTMFKETDPGLLLVSKTDATVLIKTPADFDKIPTEKSPTLFPADIAGGKTYISIFIVSSMPIHRLKRATFGFYKYAARKVWIREDVFLTSDVRNIGFLIRKDPRKVSRDLLVKSLYATLCDHTFTAEISQIYHEAKEALPFQGTIPNFQLKNATNIWHTGTAGKVQTNALTIHCDQAHVRCFTRLFTSYYEDGNSNERFVPHNLLHGDDPTNLKAYRNAIILQNQYLAELRVLPVIGISPKAMNEMIQVGASPPQTVRSRLNRYSHFTSIEETTQSHELGKHLFMTTAAKFDKGKQFITNSIPQLWAKLDNAFLDELPSSVRYPRLTTSNLKDASTTRTAALLSATAIPDDITVASRWSKPPQLNQQPPKAVIVNYTDQHFPPTTNTRP
jgi:hypothetical protein